METIAKTERVPNKMSHLPVDGRGYVVPWFVAWRDGKPEFRAADGSKWVKAIRERLCWVCGGPLGSNICFVAGPMCGINRTSSEPPSHLECGRWSARNCPFLNNPNAVRRQDAEINNAGLAAASAGCAIARNPGVAMLWITRGFELFDDGTGKPLILMGAPRAVEWYAEGRRATRKEVVDSIESGIPALELLAAKESGGLEHLARQRARLEAWLPK
jgi:hypothetical protein